MHTYSTCTLIHSLQSRIPPDLPVNSWTFTVLIFFIICYVNGRDVFPLAHFSTSSVLWHFLQDLIPLKRATFNYYFVHVLNSLFGASIYLVHWGMAPYLPFLLACGYDYLVFFVTLHVYYWLQYICLFITCRVDCPTRRPYLLVSCCYLFIVFWELGLVCQLPLSQSMRQ